MSIFLDKKIPPPKPDKPVMKVNAHEAARVSNTQLLPLFPYLGPGDIVPCTALFENNPESGVRVGYFLHENTVDELELSLGSTGRMRTGDLSVGPRSHGVGGDSPDPFFAVVVVTQRQMEEGIQSEAMSYQCEKCNHILYRHDFDETVDKSDVLPALPTVYGAGISASVFNANPDLRKCGNCGHENPEFPLHLWGWGHHMWTSGVARKSVEMLSQQEVK